MSGIHKLQPNRDLQCYFERPSAIAALSNASESGFRLSGCWRQAFDWAVIEWNRDNTFEHPALRNFPDGNLSGLHLSYEESRSNCIPLDSKLYPTVDWPFLRIWTDDGGVSSFYKVSLRERATPVSGSYCCASAQFTLAGTLTPGDYVGLSWLDEQYNHQVLANDTIDSVVASLSVVINALSPTVRATAGGATISLTFVGSGQSLENSTVGANGNRIGVYGFVSATRSEYWEPSHQKFSGGVSPSAWKIEIDFGNLLDVHGVQVPTTSVRKMRWTYSADYQAAHFQRSEFEVLVSKWTVTGTARDHHFPGLGMQRLEDESPAIAFSSGWTTAPGNFSGGTTRFTAQTGSSLVAMFRTQAAQELFLGARRADNGALISVVVDNQPPVDIDLRIPGEDVLARICLGELGTGEHTVSISHIGTAGTYFYFDFLELATRTTILPEFGATPTVTLATDWDTDHSLAVPAERTVWNIHHLGFRGRVNHYVGAMWFYELERHDHVYASTTITFTGTPQFSQTVSLEVSSQGAPAGTGTVYSHQTLIGDTTNTIAKAFEFLINNGSTGIWAESSGNTLTIYARQMGDAGNTITVTSSPTSGPFVVNVTSTLLEGGQNGYWRTDLASTPRLNRAARDWTYCFLAEVHRLGMEAVVGLSMELQHGDPSVGAGIAQRYPSGNPVLLNTPALQTNFSPTSRAFWEQAFLDLATIMAAAGLTPYLQFGETQWWYFPYDNSGLPFHDAYTKAQFQSQYGFPLRVVPNGGSNPLDYPEEAEFLSNQIGDFTSEIMAFVRAQFPISRFEVLYPTDVNDGAFNRAVNFPSSWTPSTLSSLKTESFIYTLGRDFNQSLASIQFARQKGFPKEKRSHLIGINDARSHWRKEAAHAHKEQVESVVLFALDQFCLIGYPINLWAQPSSSGRQGTTG